jgi:CheY-like chemotaxis protein
VILCDLMMPRMSGMELYAEVLKISPEQAERMIFMTGGAFTPRAREFLDTTTNPRVDKPFDAASLRAAVNRMIR